MSAAKKGMKKSTYLIIWTLVIALLCSAVGVVNYEALYWDSALTLYFGEVGVKNVSTVTFDTDDHAQVANLIVAEGAVLLKNEKNALPMKGGKISLFGIDNKNGVLQKVLEDEGFTVNPTLAAFYAASSHSSGAGSLSAGNGSGSCKLQEGPILADNIESISFPGSQFCLFSLYAKEICLAPERAAVLFLCLSLRGTIPSPFK